MSESVKSHDYSHTLALPCSSMPMKVNLPDLEVDLLRQWEDQNLVAAVKKAGKGKPLFTLHDGPPYANGNIHLGHALNKVLKDALCRSARMRGFAVDLVPGWDCHGLPIEWKVEEEFMAAGRQKHDVPIEEFRWRCREFAAHWVGVQAEEFKRLGVLADFERPYLTMSYEAEALIAAELMKLAANGLVYRGSKPVLWSVVEGTALADAEVEYLDYESDSAWVKFPVAAGHSDLVGAFVVAWTTTPWTLPANRALAYSASCEYGLYEVTNAENDYGPQSGERLLFATSLVAAAAAKAKLSLRLVRTLKDEELDNLQCRHPLCDRGYAFIVPMLAGDHVNADAGTGFVHTAPGHGLDDYKVWTSNRQKLLGMGVSPDVPFVVDDEGYLTDAAPGFGPSCELGAARVLDSKGKKGDANERVLRALIDAGMLFARARYKHAYPHSWRSKKPVIFRNTPQWFVAMDQKLEDGKTLRTRALSAVDATSFVPGTGRNRLSSMVSGRPDWVLSRQRKWGVPLTLFNDADGFVLNDPEVDTKVLQAFRKEGADAWFAEGAKDRFLSHRNDAARWMMVMDVLDVWFDSGCTHAFVLEWKETQNWPADVYLEGSDQHRGWFQSSLLEACATRGRAPFKALVTHGFVVGEDGQKMAKSGKNGVSPQKIVEQHGAEVLRLWALSADYREDVRIGQANVTSAADMFRKVRNTLRWMGGMIHYFNGKEVEADAMPELEKWLLHKLNKLDEFVRKSHEEFDVKRSLGALFDFMTVDLSAFYFEVRKDTLYCDPLSSERRQASLWVIHKVFDCLVKWWAPVLPFLAEEAWLSVYPDRASVHLEQFPVVPASWRNDELAERWEVVRRVRSVVTTCLERVRKDKVIGSSLDAAPVIYSTDAVLAGQVACINWAEVCITSDASFVMAQGMPENAFVMDEMASVGVVFHHAVGNRCARSWVVSPEVGPGLSDVTKRDARALAELAAQSHK